MLATRLMIFRVRALRTLPPVIRLSGHNPNHEVSAPTLGKASRMVTGQAQFTHRDTEHAAADSRHRSEVDPKKAPSLLINGQCQRRVLLHQSLRARGRRAGLPSFTLDRGR